MTHGKNIRTSEKTSTSSPLSTGLLQRKCACGQYMVAGEECAECVKKKSSLQRKLTIGASNDPLELEADRVADQVMRMPDSKTISTIPTMSRLQRQANSSGITTTVPSIINEVLNSSGQQLTPTTRAFFEPRFGQDFSHVRIHTDHQAVKSAEALSASAYTMGSNIVFGKGQYQPTSSEGKKLLAHELVHTVQQNNTPQVIQHRVVCNEWGGNCKSVPDEPKQSCEGKSDSGNNSGNIHQKAQAAADNMKAYLGQHILFDFWAGDCRDNNKNNRVDENDPVEASSIDGSHFNGSYHGFNTINGYKCEGAWGGSMITTAFTTNTPVIYRVCADLVSQAYATAGIGLNHTQRVHDIVSWFRRNPRCRFWLDVDFPSPRHFLPGDLVCSYDPKQRHGHAAIVVSEETGVDRPMVVHLPGSSQQLRYGTYDPTSLSDVRQERWPDLRPIYGIGRYVGS